MLFPLLSPVQSLVADTVVTVQSRDTIALAADVAILVAAVTLTVAAIVFIGLMRRWYRMMGEVRGSVHQHLGPVSDRARSISDNVQFITQALRTDVERLNASVKALTARLHQASDHMEERIREFNALMEVVQEEAEDIFLDTAATVRGVREGARSMGQRRDRPSPDVPLPHEEDDGEEALPEGPHGQDEDVALPSGER